MPAVQCNSVRDRAVVFNRCTVLGVDRLQLDVQCITALVPQHIIHEVSEAPGARDAGLCFSVGLPATAPEHK